MRQLTVVKPVLGGKGTKTTGVGYVISQAVSEF